MEFKEIVMSRYATKKFDGRKVPEEKIRELLELVRFSASALNLQPWKIKVVTDQNTRQELKPVTWNQEQVTTCSHLLVFCANQDFETLIKKLEKLMDRNNVPGEVQKMVIGLAKDLTGRMSPEQKLSYAQAHVFLALGNAINGAKALGLDSCPMGGFDPQAYARILRLPGNLVPTMLCPVGYAADTPMPKARFAYEDIVF